jgi:hypothetical protein
LKIKIYARAFGKEASRQLFFTQVYLWKMAAGGLSDASNVRSNRYSFDGGTRCWTDVAEQTPGNDATPPPPRGIVAGASCNAAFPYVHG